jgi:hypothetical protein
MAESSGNLLGLACPANQPQPAMPWPEKPPPIFQESPKAHLLQEVPQPSAIFFFHSVSKSLFSVFHDTLTCIVICEHFLSLFEDWE